MPNVSFTGLLIVAVVAFAAPLVLALTPARRLPAIVFEIVAGIVLGLETILGAFVAGVILRLVDRDRMMTHPEFRQKLEAIRTSISHSR
jgi:Kef-type K+ transport system membrane component KefB